MKLPMVLTQPASEIHSPLSAEHSSMSTASQGRRLYNKKRIAVDKKTDCTAERNRRKYRVWNSHGHVTTLSMAIPDAEISAVRLSPCVVAQQNILRHKWMMLKK